jgi:hypothetical protein
MAIAELKGKKRAGSDLAAEASKLMAVEEEVGGIEGGTEAQEDDYCGIAVEVASEAGKGKKMKWRVSQDQIDFILSMDVSDYVFAAPDNLDHLPISDEYKAQYRAERKQAVAVMQESRAAKRKMQEWVKAELEKEGVKADLEKHGYVEIETTSEMLEKYGYVQIETTAEMIEKQEYIDGQIS